MTGGDSRSSSPVLATDVPPNAPWGTVRGSNLGWMCGTPVMPMWAPSCFGSAAMVVTASNAAWINGPQMTASSGSAMSSTSARGVDTTGKHRIRGMSASRSMGQMRPRPRTVGNAGGGRRYAASRYRRRSLHASTSPSAAAAKRVWTADMTLERCVERDSRAAVALNGRPMAEERRTGNLAIP